MTLPYCHAAMLYASGKVCDMFPDFTWLECKHTKFFHWGWGAGWATKHKFSN